MNTTTNTPQADTLDHIPLNLIRVSTLEVQALRRERFDAAGLIELAASIKQLGIQQPIVVRAITRRDDIAARYEIICGERRFLAADRAGLGHIPCVIRELDDTQALEVLMSENLGRADMHALEEGAGFKALMDQRQLDAQAVGALFGKSKSYVYARVKLLDLCPDARTALQSGELDASKALLIARMPSEKAQQAGLKLALQTEWNGEPCSYKVLFDSLRRKTLCDLNRVRWALDDADLADPIRGRLPACTACPYYSGNDPDLAGDDPNAHVCADEGCYADKGIAWQTRQRVDLEAAGHTVLAGDAAKAVLRGGDVVGHVDLDHECYDDEYPEPEPERIDGETDDAFDARCQAWDDAAQDYTERTYRTLLAGADIPSTWAVDPRTGELRELAPVDRARTWLADTHQIFLSAHVGRDTKDTATLRASADTDWKKQQVEQRAKQAKEIIFRRGLFNAIAAKCSGPLKTEDLIAIAEEMIGRAYGNDPLSMLYGNNITPAKLKPEVLPKLIRLAILNNCATEPHNNNKPLLDAAKRWKIDVAALKKQLAVEAKAAEKGTKK